MNANRHLPLPAKSLIAVLLVVVCIMFFMAWTNVAFRDYGHSRDLVFNASRIVGLPIMTGLVWLIVRQHQDFLARLFSTDGLTLKLIVTGVLIGVLARILSWSMITGRAALGILPSSISSPPLQLQLAYDCPNIPVLILSVAVWFVLVPVSEEFVHRGVVLSAVANRGPLVAIGLSAVFFTMMHSPDAYPFVLMFGIVFGIFFWNVRSLWPPIATHATYDGLKIIDSVCLRIAWNPPRDDIPMVSLGAICMIIGVGCTAAIGLLISKRWVGPRTETQPVAEVRTRLRLFR